MSDEITETAVAETAPAVIEEAPVAVGYADMTDSQKLDLLHHKMDQIGNQTSWIGQTLSGIIDMVGKVSPMDIFKMMRGGK